MQENEFTIKLLNFFNSRKWFWIKTGLDIASVVFLALILWYLYNHINLLLTNPCELCEDLGRTCIPKVFN